MECKIRKGLTGLLAGSMLFLSGFATAGEAADESRKDLTTAGVSETPSAPANANRGGDPTTTESPTADLYQVNSTINEPVGSPTGASGPGACKTDAPQSPETAKSDAKPTVESAPSPLKNWDIWNVSSLYDPHSYSNTDRASTSDGHAEQNYCKNDAFSLSNQDKLLKKSLHFAKSPSWIHTSNDWPPYAYAWRNRHPVTDRSQPPSYGAPASISH